MEAKTLIHYNNTSFIDLKMLLNLCENDTDSILEIMDMFIDSIKKIFRQLNSAYQEKKVELIYAAAHKAKSSLSIVQIKALWDGMNKLEDEAREQHWKKEWGVIIEQLSKAWQQIEPLLQQWRKEAAHAKSFQN